MSVQNIEEVDLREVCETLGLTIRRGRIPCPSPDHRETHSDNCQVKQSSNGRWLFRCFVCGVWGDAVELVRLVRDLPKPSAFAWLRENGFVEGDAPPQPRRRMDEKEYLAFVEIFLAPGGEDRAGWLMVKHLEWKREKASFRQRVAQIITKNRTLNEQAFRGKQAQEKMRRWEATGEGFPSEEIEARIRKERWGYLNTRIRRGTSVHNLEQGIRGY